MLACPRSLRLSLTTAQVAARQASEAAFAAQRAELLSGANVGALQRQYKQQADLVAGAQDISSGLVRTRQVRGCGSRALVGDGGAAGGGAERVRASAHPTPTDRHPRNETRAVLLRIPTPRFCSSR
jgi:hypothetical protein